MSIGNSHHSFFHPIQDIKYEEIRAILDYMYKGEVNVAQDHLPGLLKVAELLKVKGLVEEEREKLLNAQNATGKVNSSSNNLSSSSDLFNDDSNGSPIKKVSGFRHQEEAN